MRISLRMIVAFVAAGSQMTFADDPAAPSPSALSVAFAARDADHDHNLNLREFLAGVLDEQLPVFRRNFRVVDLDGNGLLALDEFALIPGNPASLEERAAVADPILALEADEFQKWLDQFKTADKDSDGALSVEEWSAVTWSPLTTGLSEIAFDAWDANQNAQVGIDEGERVFQQAFALIRPKGGTIRTPYGVSINWIHIRQIDRNLDDQLSRDEFIAGFNAGPERNVEIFTALDVDADGIASIAELCTSPWFRVDLIGWFLAWDDSLDAALDESELKQHSAPWQLAIAQHLVEAFDRDGDRKLSLHETLEIPFLDYNTDWYALRTDLNHDGYLSWKEFHPELGTAGVAVSRHFFGRFDRDQNGLLSRDEYTFHIDWQRVPAELVFRNTDTDRDGQLTLDEIFKQQIDPGADDVARAQFDARRKYHEGWLNSADANHDGTLSLNEYQRGRPRFHPAAFDAFVARNSDHDGGVVLAEYLSPIDEASKARASRDFLIVDWNKDGKLDWNEFSCLPGIGTGRGREAVPDPIVDDVRHRFNEIVAIVLRNARNAEDRWNQGDWPASEIGKALPELNGIPFSAWDLDQDGLITRAECLRLLEISFGVRHSSGGLNRLSNGCVFNVIQLDRSDLNQDHVLSHDEFVTTYPADPKQIEQIFEAIDSDHSRVLEWDEMVNSPYLSADVLDQFLSYDTDFNGTIDQQELNARCAPWQQLVGKWLIRAFDVDADGRLSFPEYRTTPFENLIADWYSPPQDRDQDGQISWAEYDTKASPYQASLYRKYFEAFDRDKSGRLTVDEFDFRYDRNNISSDLLFNFIDLDHDGAVSFDEYLMPVEEQGKARGRRDFLTVDWNQDGILTWDEYSCLPGINSERPRGTVPDPIVDAVERRLESVLAILLKHSSGPDDRWATKSWPTSAIGRLSPELTTIPASAWDLNRDGQITKNESKDYLEILFGVRHKSGGLNRLPNGCVFSVIQLDRSDLNKDYKLSRAEFVTTYPADPKKIEEIFASIDSDHSGILEWTEMINSPHLSANALNQFFDYDSDFSGSLDQQELDAKCASWQRIIGKRLMRAFDVDRDGRLSFREYRSSPFENLIADWYSPPQDSNNDGRLSWSEFYTRPAPEVSSLFRHYFTAFDRDKNGYLSSDEFEFSVDLKRMSSESAFAAQDVNSDGKLTLDEYFSEARPATTNKEELEHYERRLAAAETNFLSEDLDRDGSLNINEFQQARKSSWRAAEQEIKSKTGSKGTGGDDWTFNLFLILHAVILIGVACYFMPSRSRSAKGATK